jgi:hypothetical protein
MFRENVIDDNVVNCDSTADSFVYASGYNRTITRMSM